MIPADGLLSHTAARVLRVLLAQRAATRPELSQAVGVTKQTVSAAVEELEQHGLIAAVAVQQGATGRSALQYGLDPSAGWVAGVDLGSSRLRVAAARLDGVVLTDRLLVDEAATARRNVPAQIARAADALDGLARELAPAHGPLLGIAFAVPGPVAAPRDLLTGPRGELEELVLEAVRPLSPAHVWTENDVDCEALAQLRYRAGEVPASVLHLHVGVGVGAALIADGRIVRGARGRAGEIGPWPSPHRHRGATVEDALGAAGLLAAAGHSARANLASSVADLFSAAALGDPAAETAVEDEVTGVASVLEVLVALIDPDLVVLSGQLAGREDLGRLIVQECRRRGMETPVTGDSLGDAAAVLGAVSLAAGRAVDLLERRG